MTLQGGHLLVTQCRVENENFTDLDPTVGRYAVLVPGPDDEIAGGRGDRIPVVDLVFLVAIRPLGPFEGLKGLKNPPKNPLKTILNLKKTMLKVVLELLLIILVMLLMVLDLS